MIANLASPTVCVVDDEPTDYIPILNALLRLGIGCVHIKGDDVENLPPTPFTGLRLVFMDLHLTSDAPGKTAVSRAVSVFCRVVAARSFPVVVVIWSKYANQAANDPDLPPEDQPREADLFKETLLEVSPQFTEQLIFVEMPKPFGDERPSEQQWTEELKIKIQEKVRGLDAFDALWKWESVVREAGDKFNGELSRIASVSEGGNQEEKSRDLKLLLRMLAHEQGGPDCTSDNAHRHLALVLAQSLADQLEHADSLNALSEHGQWLSEREGVEETKASVGPRLNSLLLTSSCPAQTVPFVPGTVFRVTDLNECNRVMGIDAEDLFSFCHKEGKKGKGLTQEQWQAQVKPILVELTADCDFQQNNRCQSLLLGGLLVPAAGRDNVKTADFIQCLPTFKLRWPIENFGEQDVFLVFCSRYKLTMPSSSEPMWLSPWFRLRDLPTASLRNWHASHSSRVGYVSF